MRRISLTLKEHILWSRCKAVSVAEQQELHAETYSKEEYESLADIYDAMLDGIRGTLVTMIGIEVNEIVEEFNLDRAEPNSAMPDIEQIEESIDEYSADLVDDIMELNSLPAIAIADELESWLNDLYTYHAARDN
jgi:hypothetical protein